MWGCPTKRNSLHEWAEGHNVTRKKGEWGRGDREHLHSTSKYGLLQKRQILPVVGLFYEVGVGAYPNLKPPWNYMAPPQIPHGVWLLLLDPGCSRKGGILIDK